MIPKLAIRVHAIVVKYNSTSPRAGPVAHFFVETWRALEYHNLFQVFHRPTSTWKVVFYESWRHCVHFGTEILIKIRAELAGMKKWNYFHHHYYHVCCCLKSWLPFRALDHSIVKVNIRNEGGKTLLEKDGQVNLTILFPFSDLE